MPLSPEEFDNLLDGIEDEDDLFSDPDEPRVIGKYVLLVIRHEPVRCEDECHSGYWEFLIYDKEEYELEEESLRSGKSMYEAEPLYEKTIGLDQQDMLMDLTNLINTEEDIEKLIANQ